MTLLHLDQPEGGRGDMVFHKLTLFAVFVKSEKPRKSYREQIFAALDSRVQTRTKTVLQTELSIFHKVSHGTPTVPKSLGSYFDNSSSLRLNCQE